MTCQNILHRRQLVGTALRRYLKHDNDLVQYAARWLFDPAHAHPRGELALQVAEVLGTASENHATLAAAVELIHASLYLHYHVREETGGRQGPDAVLAGLGNAANVLLGDLFYTAAFRAIVDLKNHRIARILSDATTAIAEAEVLELQMPACAEINSIKYISIIRGKTGKLFEAIPLPTSLSRVLALR
jgi:octaprenyl-diphosphate synthase